MTKLRDLLKFILLTSIMVLFMASLSYAQKKKSNKSKSSKAPKRQVLDFEEELITGDAKSPDLMPIFNAEDPNFKKLIRLRKHFLPEMRRTSEDVEKSGSGS